MLIQYELVLNSDEHLGVRFLTERKVFVVRRGVVVGEDDVVDVVIHKHIQIF